MTQTIAQLQQDTENLYNLLKDKAAVSGFKPDTPELEKLRIHQSKLLQAVTQYMFSYMDSLAKLEQFSDDLTSFIRLVNQDTQPSQQKSDVEELLKVQEWLEDTVKVLKIAEEEEGGGTEPIIRKYP
jgi:hypothetical protein